MRLSPSYRAARLRHIARMGMQCTVHELRNMQTALEARYWDAGGRAAVLFDTDHPEDTAAARRIAEAEARPAMRLLEIVKCALEVAATRRIANRS